MRTATQPLPAGRHRFRRSWLLVVVLTLAIAISYVDRYALAMLAEPIKRDIGLSDTGLGVLTGFAFSAFYGVFGLAMARASDSAAAARS